MWNSESWVPLVCGVSAEAGQFSNQDAPVVVMLCASCSDFLNPTILALSKVTDWRTAANRPPYGNPFIWKGEQTGIQEDQMLKDLSVNLQQAYPNKSPGLLSFLSILLVYWILGTMSAKEN